MRGIGIAGNPHHCLYICPLENRCLMGTQCGLVLGAFHVVRGWVHLLLRVLTLRVLVPGVLVPGMLLLP